MSDINLTYSTIARQNLLKEGIKNDLVIKVGSPLYEVFFNNKEKILKSNILEKLSIKKRNYFLVSLHREENTKDKKSINNIINILNEINNKFQKDIIFPCHPKIKIILENKNKNKN